MNRSKQKNKTSTGVRVVILVLVLFIAGSLVVAKAYQMNGKAEEPVMQEYSGEPEQESEPESPVCLNTEPELPEEPEEELMYGLPEEWENESEYGYDREPEEEDIYEPANEEEPQTESEVLGVNIINISPERLAMIDPELPMVALTFDDGPHRLTPQILDILDKYDAVATFYVIGMQIEAHTETIQRIIDSGSEVANHSWSHLSFERNSASTVRAQIEDTNDIIEEVTGIRPTQLRPPFGRTNRSVENISKELGMSMIMWSIDPSDYLDISPYRIYSHIMDKVQDRDIILLHDIYDRSVEATRSLVPDLISRGYQLVTVSELMYFSNITPEPGTIYRHGRDR